MIHNIYKVASIMGEDEETAPNAEEAALGHVRKRQPMHHVIVTARCGKTTYAFHIKPIISYHAFPVPKPRLLRGLPMTPAAAFKMADPAAREVALMTLKKRASSLGIESAAYRDVGLNDIADVLIGQQTAVLAALEVLRELHNGGTKHD